MTMGGLLLAGAALRLAALLCKNQQSRLVYNKFDPQSKKKKNERRREKYGAEGPGDLQ